ncbi:MAG: glycosyltransferase family 2 protein [Patescibacteria group bacterium]
MNRHFDVSVVVISFNTRKLTLDCLDSVIQHTRDVIYEVIIVDNASTDGSLKEIEKFTLKHKNTHLVKSKENLGFGGGNNLGMQKAKGRYILLLNSDTKLYEDSISKMVEWMDNHPTVGISTCKLKNPNGSIQPTGGYMPTLFRLFSWAFFLDDLPCWSTLFGSYHPHADFYKKQRSLDWITGAFMLIRRETYESVGGFDSNFHMYAEDVEYCYRFKLQGFQLIFVPTTSITHIGGASSTGDVVHFKDSAGKERSIVGEFEGLKLFYKKHFPSQYSIASTIMKFGAILRMIIFGLFLGQPKARKIYVTAFKKI